MLELQAASVAGPDERQPIVTANIAIVLIERAHQLILRRRRTLPADEAWGGSVEICHPPGGGLVMAFPIRNDEPAGAANRVTNW